MRSTLLDGLRPGADRLAAVFRYLEPEAPPQALAAFLARRLGEAAQPRRASASSTPATPRRPSTCPTAATWRACIRSSCGWSPSACSIPEATWPRRWRRATKERQQVYRWLFRTRAKGAQDSRIFTLLEVEAFLEIHRRWARLGYPFGHLVPSLATALGSSGDRPAALAELMGIIVNDGLRLPDAAHRHGALRAPPRPTRPPSRSARRRATR